MIMNKLSNEIELTDADAALSDEELELSVGGQIADGPTTATKGKTAFCRSLVGDDGGAGAKGAEQAQ
jgi:hypothetical protein